MGERYRCSVASDGTSRFRALVVEDSDEVHCFGSLKESKVAQQKLAESSTLALIATTPQTIDLTIGSDNEDDFCIFSSPPCKRRASSQQELKLSVQEQPPTSGGHRATSSSQPAAASAVAAPVAPIPEYLAPHGASNESAVGVYDLQAFKELWKEVEKDIGASMEFLESQRGVRRANRKLDRSDSTTQEMAQYGRMLPDATQVVLERHLKLDPECDVFLDFGHGIGNAVLQAAYVFRCEARGIEVIQDRNVIALAFESGLDIMRIKIHKERDGIDFQVGEVEFKRGSLEAEEHRAFLSQPPAGKQVIKALCNNYNAVFSDRSAKSREKHYLDDYLAGLFALMPPGSVLITLHPLNMVCPGRSETQRHREKQGLVCGSKMNASFYELEEVELGPARDCVTWAHSSSTDQLFLYKYTRLEQEVGVTEAVSQCCNPACERARSGEAIRATQFVPMVYSSGEQGVVLKSCGCAHAGKMALRRRNKVVNYYKTGDTDFEV